MKRMTKRERYATLHGAVTALELAQHQPDKAPGIIEALRLLSPWRDSEKPRDRRAATLYLKVTNSEGKAQWDGPHKKRAVDQKIRWWATLGFKAEPVEGTPEIEHEVRVFTLRALGVKDPERAAKAAAERDDALRAAAATPIDGDGKRRAKPRAAKSDTADLPFTPTPSRGARRSSAR